VNNALILLYHRIANSERDPQALCVRPSHFAEHLSVLRRSYNPRSLRDLHLRLKDGGLLRGWVAVTFDDGYADNLEVARPALEDADIPATVFIVSGQIGSSQAFWWDELDRTLLVPEVLPETLELKGHDWKYNCSLDVHEAVEDADTDTSRNVTKRFADGRYQAYRDLMRLLRTFGSSEREAVLAELRAWSGVDAAVEPALRALDPDGVRQLTRDNLIEVGAHTISHVSLASRPIAEQDAEIAGSKSHLEDLIGHPVTSFSYPYGSRSFKRGIATHLRFGRGYAADYNSTTIALVKAAGYERACANFGGRVSATSSALELPRVIIRDWDGDTFERTLRDFAASRLARPSKIVRASVESLRTLRARTA
jgi:peptidoglycan/xylan/chitin deacetylase (PgdA/CDA1 family)